MDTRVPAYQGKESYVFACYAHDDKSVAYPEFEQLRDLGANVWYDEGITPGESWSQEIAEAIDGADAFVCFISSALARSRHCANEIQYAMSCNKRILAIHIEETSLPGWLNLTLGSSQAVHRYALEKSTYIVKVRSFLDNQRQPVPGLATPSHSPSRRIRFGEILSRFSKSGFALGKRKRKDIDRGPAGTGQEIEIPENSIAILPFVALDEVPKSESLGAGLAEDIIGGLARQTDLRVAARTSSFAFKDKKFSIPEIAARLTVRFIVEGTIRSDGDRFRISVQLIDAADGYQLWGQTFDRRSGDMQAIKLEILNNVARMLGADAGAGDNDHLVTSTALTEVGEAYQCYLRGKYHWSLRKEDEIRKGMKLFERAIELDPDFARAYSSLAAAYVTLAEYTNDSVITAYQKAQRHAQEALKLDVTIGEAHAVIAAINSWNWDWVSAETAFRRAIEVEPTDITSLMWYSELLVDLGRLDESESLLNRTLSVDPVLAPANYLLSWLYLCKGRNEEALQFANLSVEYGQPYGYMVQSLVHIREQRIQEAIAARQKFSEALGVNAEIGREVVEALLGNREIADVVAKIESMRQQGEFSDTTVFFNYFALQVEYVLLGQRENMFRLMEDLIDQNFVRMRVLWLPEARALRNDPTLRQVAHRTGFVKAWREFGPPDQHTISESGFLSG